MDRYLKKLLKPIYFSRNETFLSKKVSIEEIHHYLTEIEKESFSLRCWLFILSAINLLGFGVMVFCVVL